MFVNKIKKLQKLFSRDRRGNILLFALVFGTISLSIIIVGVAGYAISENRASVKKHNSEAGFQIADAGINYYRWHLAHDKTDYQDGTGAPGPYVHSYTDKNGNVIGHYSLDISTPINGSTIITVTSTGWLDIQPGSRKIIKVRIGFPSITNYAFLTNSSVWIGNNESVHGKFHSNSGIRFDGTTDSLLTSAVPTYYCQPIHGGGCNNTLKPGIWGGGGPTSYWNFPVPAQDFSIITAELAQIQTKAQEDGGIYLSSSGAQGWDLSFTSSSQIIVRKVLTTNCYKSADIGDVKYVVRCIDAATYGAGTTYDMPANGFIFVEDTVWVDGVVRGRATVGTATGKSIIINNNITYVAKDGTNVLGLIAEQNILLPEASPNNLEIDAALLAQNGATKRYDFSGAGVDDRKNNLLIYGSIITNGMWTWSWVNNGGNLVSGYLNTNSTYDANLTYGPPAGFPVGAEYNIISWEVLTN